MRTLYKVTVMMVYMLANNGVQPEHTVVFTKQNKTKKIQENTLSKIATELFCKSTKARTALRLQIYVF